MFALLQLYKQNLEMQDNAANYIISTHFSQQDFWQETQLFHGLVYTQMLLFGIDASHQQ